MSAMPDTTDTAVVAPPSVTAPSPPPYKQLALKALDQVMKGNFVAVSARFVKRAHRRYVVSQKGVPVP